MIQPLFARRRPTGLAAVCGLAMALSVTTAQAQLNYTGNLSGFTEPFKRIELSSDESGAIAEMRVAEGDSVTAGQVVAQLDPRVQQLKAEIARQLASSQSAIQAAEATLEKRRSILSRLRKLAEKGHASDSEIIRAEMELAIAEAKLLSAQEEQVVREMEHRRALVELERRSIRAPVDGTVAEVHRREGEFLSPLHPEVITIVQLDRLLATFAVPSSSAAHFQPGHSVVIQMGSGRKVNATVHRLSVEEDAGSGTVEVKFLIDNSEGHIRSGEACSLEL